MKGVPASSRQQMWVDRESAVADFAGCFRRMVLGLLPTLEAHQECLGAVERARATDRLGLRRHDR